MNEISSALQPTHHTHTPILVLIYRLISLTQWNLVLIVVPRANGLHKRLVYVEVFPTFWACLTATLQALFVFCLLDHFIGDRVVDVFNQVWLCQDEHARLLWLSQSDLSLPILNVIEAVFIVGSHANHEDICVTVLRLSIDSEMLVTTGVMDFDLDLPFLYVLCTPVDI